MPVTLSNVGGSIMRNAPYVGPLYNTINSIYHLFNNSLGQHGPAPFTSPFGKFTSALGIGNSPIPQATAVNGEQPYWEQGYGQPAIDPNNPNNPLNNGGQNTGAQPPGYNNSIPYQLGGMPTNNAFNAGRNPFAPTYQQLQNPGSAIGPWGGGITNPYTGGLAGAHPTHSTGLPANYGAILDWISRQQL